MLKGILDHFAGVPIVPVGRVSEKILRELGVNALPSLRHIRRWAEQPCSAPG